MFDHLPQKISYIRNIKFNEQESETAPAEDESSMQHRLILDPIDETQSEKEK